MQRLRDVGRERVYNQGSVVDKQCISHEYTSVHRKIVVASPMAVGNPTELVIRPETQPRVEERLRSTVPELVSSFASYIALAGHTPLFLAWLPYSPKNADTEMMTARRPIPVAAT